MLASRPEWPGDFIKMHGKVGLEARASDVSTRVNIPALTGLRFVAAMMVLVAHASPVVQFDDFTLIGSILNPWAPIGMTVFFVLSGFVMWINYAHIFETERLGVALRQFCSARFARLYPLYFCVVVLAATTTPWDRLAHVMPGALAYFPLWQSWYPNEGSQILTLSIWSLGHTWSISTEAFLYLCFPIFVFTMSRRHCLAAIVVTVIVYAIFTHEVGQNIDRIARSVPSLSLGSYVTWLLYFSPVTRLFEFGMGCGAGCLFLTGWKPRSGGAHLAGFMAIAGLIATAVLYSIPSLMSYALLPTVLRVLPLIAATCLIYYVSAWQSPVSRLLSSRKAVAGGEISYSLYLLHPFLLPWFTHAPSAIMKPLALVGWLAAFIAAVFTVIVFSFGSYSLIEVPCRRWLRSTLRV
jgi:peptidoglycan/LPS O-acetylase OafA/YrhL